MINQSSTVTIVSPGLSGWLNIYGGYMGDFPEDAKMIKIGHFCCCRIRASLWTNGLFIFLSFLNYFEDILDKMTHFPHLKKWPICIFKTGSSLKQNMYFMSIFKNNQNLRASRNICGNQRAFRISIKAPLSFKLSFCLSVCLSFCLPFLYLYHLSVFFTFWLFAILSYVFSSFSLFVF